MRTRRSTWEQGVTFLCRLGVSAVFLYAGGLKVLNPAEFAVAVANYRLVPHVLVNLVAITLPSIEILVGLLLWTGPWARASAWVATGLNIAFLGFISLALARGLDIRCGCFGTASANRLGVMNLVIDSLLLGASLWVALTHRDLLFRAEKACPNGESGSK